MRRLLVIEDNEDIAAALADHLDHAGYTVRIALGGAGGLTTVRAWRPDLVVLDLMLPDVTGYEVLRQLRSEGIDVPVLILSARSDEMAKVRGFREGADDYVTKPFGLSELVARVEALLRRVPPRTGREESLVFGSIRIERAARRVLRDGVELTLRPKEFDLLLALACRPNQVVSRSELLEEAWAYEPGVESRTVDWHVAELRRKLGDDADAPALIVTVRKAGYRWSAPPPR